MAKKFLLMTLLTCSSIIVSSGHLFATKKPCNGISTTVFRPESPCPLRVIYKDCLGEIQKPVMQVKGMKKFYVNDDKISFECESGMAPTQTVKLNLNESAAYIKCTGGLGGVNLQCTGI